MISGTARKETKGPQGPEILTLNQSIFSSWQRPHRQHHDHPNASAKKDEASIAVSASVALPRLLLLRGFVVENSRLGIVKGVQQ